MENDWFSEMEKLGHESARAGRVAAERGVDDESIARIFGGSWLRVAREVWRPRT